MPMQSKHNSTPQKSQVIRRTLSIFLSHQGHHCCSVRGLAARSGFIKFGFPC